MSTLSTMHRLLLTTLACLLITAGFVVAAPGAVYASDQDDVNHPSYEVRSVTKGKDGWTATVINDKGWGFKVKGDSKKEARKNGEAAAEKANEEGGEGFASPCWQDPEACF